MQDTNWFLNRVKIKIYSHTIHLTNYVYKNKAHFKIDKKYIIINK